MVQFHGLYTALITPFKDGGIDEEALAALVERQIAGGVQGIVPVGTTGESPTLSHAEHRRVVEIAVEVAAGKIGVMAGAGSNSTAEAIEFAQHAKRVGADAILVVAPYYNKPTQNGLYEHFKAVSEVSELPNFIYNIPGRSVVNISDETLARLAELPNIAGIKDATGDLARVHSLRQLVDDDFILFSGEDITTVGFNAQGGHGVISVTANIAPEGCAEVQKHCLDGNFADARAVQDELVPLHQIMFCETNPIPVKYAASRMGLCRPDIRLPLTLPELPHQQAIDRVLAELGLI